MSEEASISEVNLEDFLQHIVSARKNYPSGIAVGSLSEAYEEAGSELNENISGFSEKFYCWGNSEALVTFVSYLPQAKNIAFSGQHGQLLAAIIEKGMHQNSESVSAAILKEDLLVSREDLINLPARYLILCGQLNKFEVDQSFFGGWRQLGDKKVFATHSLLEVATDGNIKKEFWQHLKLIMTEVKSCL